MARYKFYYRVEREAREQGEEIIDADSFEEAKKEWQEMVDNNPHDLASQASPDYPGIKIVLEDTEGLDD